MKEFCREKGLTLNETGKVILAGSPSEVETLYELKRRADSCGARAFMVDRKELRKIEPHAADNTALFSPDTAVIRPVEVLKALAEELTQSAEVTLCYKTIFKGLSGSHQANTSRGVIQFEKFISAAGCYGDRIAHQCGLAKEYKFLPFKGTYKKLSRNRTFLVRGNIYPVPEMGSQFLGVHFTRTADDEIIIGPTAIPAFGRENYQTFAGLGWETFPILFRDSVLLFTNHTFRQAALTEPKKYLKRFVLKQAQRLVPELRLQDIVESDQVGIRPQLIHWPTKTLVMDFVVLRDGDSLHILNPISPALTSSMAFAKDVVNRLLK